MADHTPLKAVEGGADRDAVESAVFEIKRVIAGQDEMLERVFVCLLAGGHLLIEGVPGLAKTLTVKTVADVFGGSSSASSSRPTSCRPTSSARGCTAQRSERVRHRARAGLLQLPARRRDQPRARQGAVGAARGDAGAAGDDRQGDATPCRRRSSSWRRRTRSSPRAPIRCPRPRSTASCSRSLVDYPRRGRRADGDRARARRSGRGRAAASRSRSSPSCRLPTRRVYVDPAVSRYALDDRARDAPARRRRARGSRRSTSRTAPARAGRSTSSLGARALALLRGRRYVLPQDVRELAKDVLRHRMVLSYEALAEGVEADTVLDRVLETVAMPHVDLARGGRRMSHRPRRSRPARTPGRPGPGPTPGALLRQLEPDRAAAHRQPARRRPPRRGRSATAPSSRRCGRTSSATTSAASTGT